MTPPPSAPPSSDGPGAPAPKKRSLLPILGVLALIAVAVVVVIVVTSGGSSKPSGQPFAATLQPVPTNQVTGAGSGTVSLNGDVATVDVNAHGLLNGAPHAMHIHAGGRGVCPPASAARKHNGHLSISTTDGIKFYGPPQVSLTSGGDTSPKSIVDFSRYPSTGTIHYTRAITIPAGVADAIRAGNAALIIHGIDYNHNGIYDNVLDRSELKNSLTGESTAPAVCGPLVPTKTADVSGHMVTTYAFVLDRRAAIAELGEHEYVLLCHLLGINPGAASDPRAGAGPTAS